VVAARAASASQSRSRLNAWPSTRSQLLDSLRPLPCLGAHRFQADPPTRRPPASQAALLEYALAVSPLAGGLGPGRAATEAGSRQAPALEAARKADREANGARAAMLQQQQLA